MTPLVFVHGISIRAESFSKSFDKIQSKIRKRFDVTIHPCLWGDSFGAKLPKTPKSIPYYGSYGGGKVIKERSDPVALWHILYDNPWYELDLLACKPAPPTSPIPGRQSASSVMLKKVKDDLFRLPTQVALAAWLVQAEIDILVFSRLAQDLARDLEVRFLKAASSSTDTPAEYRLAIARSLVAQTITAERVQNRDVRIAKDAKLRDEFVEVIFQNLGESYLAVGQWLVNMIAPLITNRVARARGRITDLIVPFVGDVLAYQNKGGVDIRKHIHRSIKQAVTSSKSDSVVLLAHSLGGIACVDLLADKKAANDKVLQGVALLVTVGSQGPLLYELDALESLRFGEALPKHFPEWINIYDPWDFLSYKAEDVFGLSETTVKDIEVNNKQPFPESHSAYWDNDETWNALANHLPQRAT
jgi:hypothetical protein